MINIWDNPEQLFDDNRFENYENKIKDKYKIVVVGIDNNNHLFYITFENIEQARRFILKNHKKKKVFASTIRKKTYKPKKA